MTGKALLAGVDTLDLGLYVRWDTQWEFHAACFETWKQRAAGTNGILIEGDLLPIGAAGKHPIPASTASTTELAASDVSNAP